MIFGRTGSAGDLTFERKKGNVRIPVNFFARNDLNVHLMASLLETKAIDQRTKTVLAEGRKYYG